MKSLHKRINHLESKDIDFTTAVPDRPLTNAEFEELRKHVSLFDLLEASDSKETHPDVVPTPDHIMQKFITECERRGIIYFGADHESE